MNSPVHIDPELHEFVKKDRVRLITERNEFKRLSEQHEIELAESQQRSQKVISILLVMNIVLIGALAYVLYNT